MQNQPTSMGLFISTFQGGNLDLNPPIKPRLAQTDGNTFMTNHLGKQGIPCNGKMVCKGFVLNGR